MSRMKDFLYLFKYFASELSPFLTVFIAVYNSIEIHMTKKALHKAVILHDYHFLSYSSYRKKNTVGKKWLRPKLK